MDGLSTRAELARRCSPSWLPHQRWFAGKGRPIDDRRGRSRAGCSPSGRGAASASPGRVVRTTTARADRYQLLLGTPRRSRRPGSSTPAIGGRRSTTAAAWSYDAPARHGAHRRLLAGIADGPRRRAAALQSGPHPARSTAGRAQPGHRRRAVATPRWCSATRTSSRCSAGSTPGVNPDLECTGRWPSAAARTSPAARLDRGRLAARTAADRRDAGHAAGVPPRPPPTAGSWP